MSEFFLHSERLWHLLWAIPLITFCFLFANNIRKKIIAKTLGASHFSKNKNPIGINASPIKRFFQFLFATICISFLIAAYAKPSWGTKIIPIGNMGRDIVFALDLSKSMLCEDVAPSRLEHAKLFISKITDTLAGNRFGLVSFAGSSYNPCPLTFDRISFQQILKEQTPEIMPIGGTNLEKALITAEKCLGKQNVVGHSAIVLITDGGELSGSLLKEAELLKTRKIPVLVIGVGDSKISSPIPLNKSGNEINKTTSYLKDNKGKIVLTKLEDVNLKTLATKTNSIYLHSSTLNLNDKNAADWIKALTPTADESGTKKIPIERWHWFVACATFFFFLFILINETMRNKRRKEYFHQLLNVSKVLIVLGTISILMPTEAHCENESPASQEKPDNIIEEKKSNEEIFYDALETQKKGDDDTANKKYEPLLNENINTGIKNSVIQNIGVIHQTKARKISTTAESTAQNDLDASLKKIKSAEEEFEIAEELYRQLLNNPKENVFKTALENQKNLRNDLKRSQELKKKIEALKEALKKAEEEIKKAQENQKKSQQEQNQKKQQQSQKSQEESNQSREKAQQSAQEMNDLSNDLKNQSYKDLSNQVQKNLQKAQEAQEKGDKQKANEHLQEALKLIKQNEEKENRKGEKSKDEKNDQNKQNEKDKDSDKKGAKEDKNEDLSKVAEKKASKEDKKEVEPTVLDAILREMLNEENERRKEVIKGNNKEIEVEKDW